MCSWLTCAKICGSGLCVWVWVYEVVQSSVQFCKKVLLVAVEFSLIATGWTDAYKSDSDITSRIGLHRLDGAFDEIGPYVRRSVVGIVGFVLSVLQKSCALYEPWTNGRRASYIMPVHKCGVILGTVVMAVLTVMGKRHICVMCFFCSLVTVLLDEIVSSAVQRCVEPVLMEQSVVEAICDRGWVFYFFFAVFFWFGFCHVYKWMDNKMIIRSKTQWNSTSKVGNDWFSYCDLSRSLWRVYGRYSLVSTQFLLRTRLHRNPIEIFWDWLESRFVTETLKKAKRNGDLATDVSSKNCFLRL